MDPEGLAAHPGALYDCSVADVEYLLHDVEFDESVVAFFFTVEFLYFGFETGVDIADVAKPVIYESKLMIFHGGFYAAAAVVATDNYVLDFEEVDSIF